MRLQCLSNHPSKPCYWLKLPNVSILLDAGLDLTPMLQFLPVTMIESPRLAELPTWKPKDYFGSLSCLKESAVGQVFVSGLPEVVAPDLSLVKVADLDAILISNYTCMMALPFITEVAGFKGTVYATDPTLQLGRLLMEELVQHVECAQTDPADPKWKLPDVVKQLPLGSLKEDSPPVTWKQMYNSKTLASSLAKVQLVAYREKVNLFGSVSVTPVSSGYQIGSCNWILDTDYERLVYLSGSSSLATHPRSLDISLLGAADAFVVTSLNQMPALSPDTMVRDICNAVVATVREGGNVLIPCYPMGICYDLFEYLYNYLDNNNLSNVPIFFISPVAKSSVSLANIFCEWLSESRQSKAYLPDDPFLHYVMEKNGRFMYYTGVQDKLSEDFKTPCIVFAGHPSLRVGDAVHFVELWASEPKNTMILIEPDFALPEVLTPFQPLAMKALFCPIDTTLDFATTNKYLKDFKPKRLYAHERYARPPFTMPGRTDLMLSYDPFLTMRRGHVVSMPVQQKWAKLRVQANLASKIDLEEVGKTTSVCPLLGLLSAYNGHYELRPPSTSQEKDLMAAYYPAPYGNCDPEVVIKRLKQAGFDPKHDKRPGTGGVLVTLAKEGIIVEIEPQKTHIMCDGVNDVSRRKVCDIVMSCVKKL